MAYTILDLIDKLIMIEQSACNMYKSIAKINSSEIPKFKAIANILALEEERHAEYYTQIRNEAADFADIELDFDLYDRASEMINEFRKRIKLPAEVDIKGILEFALAFEKQNAALLIDIKGRLFKKSEDSQSTISMALTDLIIEEEKHVKNLMVVLKKE